MNTKTFWPSFLETGNIPPNYSRASAIADGLMGWGNCMSGNTPCANFGKGMAALSKYLGEPVFSENLHKMADKLIATEITKPLTSPTGNISKNETP